jgi:hypothetical protein
MGDDKKVKKVGTKEVQREGFEYELTLNFNIDRDSHMVVASKDNTRLFEGKDPFVITEETGKVLADWVASGAIDKTEEEKKKLRNEIIFKVGLLGKEMEWLEKQAGSINLKTVEELTGLSKQLQDLVDKSRAVKKEPLSGEIAKSAAKHITSTPKI